MEMKKLSNLVIDFFRNDIVWLVFYLAFATTVVERSITWLFFFRFCRRHDATSGTWALEYGPNSRHFILGLALVGNCSKYVSHGDRKLDGLLANPPPPFQLRTLLRPCHHTTRSYHTLHTI